MRAFLRAEGDTLGFFCGLGLIVVGVGLWSVPAALIVTGLAIAGVAAGFARSR